jgi:predicted extracellular nuclease
MKANIAGSLIGTVVIIGAMIGGVFFLKSESSKGKVLYGSVYEQEVTEQPSKAGDLRILEINTEFLWDDDGDNEGMIVDKYITSSDYNRELSYYAGLIEDVNANIVGLVEIEGCHVAHDLAAKLGSGWNVGCMEGRDSYTGQDVGVVTRFDVRSVDNFRGFKSFSRGRKLTASKVVGVSLSSFDKNYYVVVAHLISKRSDNDEKRLKQAESIYVGVKELARGHDAVVVMGDLNDFPKSEPVRMLKEIGLLSPAEEDDCSYVYRGECNLIDHILISPNIAGGVFETIDMDSKFSDHKAVFYGM